MIKMGSFLNSLSGGEIFLNDGGAALSLEDASPESLNFGLDINPLTLEDNLTPKSKISDTPIEFQTPSDLAGLDLFDGEDEVMAMESSIAQLSELMKSVRSRGGINSRGAIEMKRLLPGSLPSLSIEHYTQEITKTNYKVSLEEMSKGFVALISAAILAGVYLIYRFIRWLFGNPVSESEGKKSKDPKKTKEEISDIIDSGERVDKYLDKVESSTEDALDNVEKAKEAIHQHKYAKPLILNGKAGIDLYREEMHGALTGHVALLFKSKQNFTELYSWEDGVLQYSAGSIPNNVVGHERPLHDRSIHPDFLEDNRMGGIFEWEKKLRNVKKSVYDFLANGKNSEFMKKCASLKAYYDDIIDREMSDSSSISFFIDQLESLLNNIFYLRKPIEGGIDKQDTTDIEYLNAAGFKGKDWSENAGYNVNVFPAQDDAKSAGRSLQFTYEEIFKNMDFKDVSLSWSISGNTVKTSEAIASFTNFWSNYDSESNVVKVNSFDEMFLLIKKIDMRSVKEMRDAIDKMAVGLAGYADKLTKVNSLINLIYTGRDSAGHDLPILSKITSDLNGIASEYNRKVNYLIKVSRAFTSHLNDVLNYAPLFVGFYRNIINRHIRVWQYMLKYTEDLTGDERKKIEESRKYFSDLVEDIQNDLDDMQKNLKKTLRRNPTRNGIERQVTVG